MATLDGPSAQAAAPVVIYDRRDCGLIHGLGVQERVAACYRWASARGRQVVEQFVSFGDAVSPLPAALSRALDACTTSGATLLVYDVPCLSDDPATLDAVTGHLSGRVLLTVADSRRSAGCEVAP